MEEGRGRWGPRKGRGRGKEELLLHSKILASTFLVPLPSGKASRVKGSSQFHCKSFSSLETRTSSAARVTENGLEPKGRGQAFLRLLQPQVGTHRFLHLGIEAPRNRAQSFSHFVKQEGEKFLIFGPLNDSCPLVR